MLHKILEIILFFYKKKLIAFHL